MYPGLGEAVVERCRLRRQTYFFGEAFFFVAFFFVLFFAFFTAFGFVAFLVAFFAAFGMITECERVWGSSQLSWVDAS